MYGTSWIRIELFEHEWMQCIFEGEVKLIEGEYHTEDMKLTEVVFHRPSGAVRVAAGSLSPDVLEVIDFRSQLKWHVIDENLIV